MTQTGFVLLESTQYLRGFPVHLLSKSLTWKPGRAGFYSCKRCFLSCLMPTRTPVIALWRMIPYLSMLQLLKVLDYSYAVLQTQAVDTSRTMLPVVCNPWLLNADFQKMVHYTQCVPEFFQKQFYFECLYPFSFQCFLFNPHRDLIHVL